MKLPRLSDPHQYAGLYVYDFGDHVSVGYTAGEIRMLREMERYCGGTAYELYRVDESGAIELRGAGNERLAAIEAFCFLRRDGAAARRDYESLKEAAKHDPVYAPVELSLVRAYEFDPPDVTALLYPVASSMVVSTWLQEHAPGFGDEIHAGQEAYARFARSSGMRIDSCQLAARMDYADRPVDDVLASIDRPCQR